MDSENNLNIIKYIIRNTPYGLLKETIEHLKILVGQSVLEDEAVLEELKLYDEEHLRQINYNDEKIVISKYNRNEENMYYDNQKKLKFSISALSENFDKIIQLEDHDLPKNEFVELLSKSLNAYKEKYYDGKISAATGIII